MTAQLNQQSDSTQNLRNEQFLLTEYHEAATSYANGVDIGFSTTKTFVAIHGVLLTVQVSPTAGADGLEIVKTIQMVAPVFGMLTSLLLLALISLYFHHLNNCLDRCCQIEALFGGKLFTGNQAVPKQKGPNTGNALYVIAMCAFLLWAILAPWGLWFGGVVQMYQSLS